MKNLIIIVCVFLGTAIQAQVLKEFRTGFRTIFINPVDVNSYYFGFNPALLTVNPEDELLSLSTDFSLSDGEFKRFVDPKSNHFYQLRASGRKAIDTSQNFKGSFSLHRSERNDWTWIFTRDYQTSNPFLIGDSTTGNSRLNGIQMTAEYSNKIIENLSIGIALDYSVDEMLKEISPRPTSEHRDIQARLGLNFSAFSELNLGIVADIYDKNEELSYREDEGSITQETIILKFKGYDFPNVLRKKTETRYSYTNGYAGGLNFSYNLARSILAAGYIFSGFDKTIIKDDAIDPSAEGLWMNNNLTAGLQLFADVEEQIKFGLIYNGRIDDGWAKYSPYNVLYYEREGSEHSAACGMQYSFNNKISAGLELGASFNSHNEHDYYSTVENYINSNLYFGRAGLGITWSDEFYSIISYAFHNRTIPEFSFISKDQSDYFNYYRKEDILYLLTESSGHELSFSAKITPKFWGSFYIYFNWMSNTPKNASYFTGRIRNEFKSSIEYRVKIY
ncbi:MAG: hypothetical protein HXY50_11285 [Ignavibacteriaceae bacterium]|nr:hypothetical protein [Ignavibacteriaceae bacterium]